MKTKLIGICLAVCVSSAFASGEDILLGLILGTVIAPRPLIVQPDYRDINRERHRLASDNSCSYIYDSVDRAYCLGAQERRLAQLRAAEHEAYRRGLEGR